MNADSALKKFSGIYVAAGEIRRVVYEAKDITEAKLLASKWGVGIEGETVAFSGESPPPLPEVSNEKTARYLLGGISHTTLYAELATGRLQRIAGTRRSIESRCELN